MTVQTTQNRADYNGNGVTTTFAVPFRFLLNTDLLVVYENGVGGVFTLNFPADYSVSGARAPGGGSITLTSIVPSSLARISILRNVPETQLTDYIPNDPFPAESHEDALDKLTMLVQQLQEEITRCIKYPPQIQSDGTIEAPDGTKQVIGFAPFEAGPVLYPFSEESAAGLYAAIALQNYGLGLTLDGTIAGSRINQTNNNKHFVGNGSRIHRMADRLFVSGAIANDGAFPNVAQDWLSAYQASNGVPPGIVSASTAVVTNNDSNQGHAIVGGAQTLYTGANDSAAIGVQAYGLSNSTSFGAYAWGFYGEGQRVNNTSKAAWGMELNTANFGSLTILGPYGEVSGPAQGYTIGLQLSAGCGYTGVGQTDGSAALVLSANPKAWEKGIIFNNNSLSTQVAIAMPSTYGIQWYGPGNVTTAQVRCSATTTVNSMKLLFLEGGTGFYSSGDRAQLFIGTAGNAVNNLSVIGSATGQPVVLTASGSDTNIDLSLATKGTGRVRLGPHTANADAPVTGYIEVKDSTGTVRKLAVIA